MHLAIVLIAAPGAVVLCLWTAYRLVRCASDLKNYDPDPGDPPRGLVQFLVLAITLAFLTGAGLALEWTIESASTVFRVRMTERGTIDIRFRFPVESPPAKTNP